MITFYQAENKRYHSSCDHLIAKQLVKTKLKVLISLEQANEQNMFSSFISLIIVKLCKLRFSKI